MTRNLFGLRAEDRRDASVAFVVLLGVMTGHAILETARDALFLARLPAGDLPWAYLAISVLTLAATALNRRWTSGRSKRRALSVTLAVGSVGTAIFWAAAGRGDDRIYFALYVWTGLLATVVVLQFWVLLTDAFDVAQAKRTFAFVGAGGLAGAVLGAGTASALLFVVAPRSLLLAASLVFAASCVAPAFFTPRAKREGRRAAPRGGRPCGWRDVTGDRYLVRLAAVAVLAALTATLIDFVFKSAVVESVGSASLARFFATYGVATSVLAIVVQVLVAPRLLRSVGVSGTLLLLPTLVALGTVGLLVGGGLAAVVSLRAIDGSLRHSLHRTSFEILHLPVATEIRDTFKAALEALAQRGGQALASVGILVALAGGARLEHVAGATLLLALSWLWVGAGLQPLYLELFRRQLRESRIDTEVSVPALDLLSMEALLAALSSEDDSEVIAALDLFEQHGRATLVPALILYHPSREVVLRALELFEGSGRTDVQRLASRLVEDEDPDVSAAALHLWAMTRPDVERLSALREADSPRLRIAALVELARVSGPHQADVEAALQNVVGSGTHDEKLGLAAAGRHLDAERHGDLLDTLASEPHHDVASTLARSFAARPHPRYLPLLVRQLGARGPRAAAREALVAMGDVALEYLDRALADPTLSVAVRRHLPRTISRFPGRLPAQILQNRLPRETDEGVQLKILRGLGRLRSNDPSLPVDAPSMLGVAEATVRRAVQLLYWRRVAELSAAHVPRARTDAFDLMVALLAEKETSALERAFRLLGVLQPREEFRIIYDGLSSADSKARAGSRELLQHVVPPQVRGALLALVDDVADDERLDGADGDGAPPGLDRLVRLRDALAVDAGRSRDALVAALLALHADCLRAMLQEPPGALRSLAGYHIAELDLETLRADVEQAAVGAPADAVGAIAAGAVDLLNRSALGGAE